MFKWERIYMQRFSLCGGVLVKEKCVLMVGFKGEKRVGFMLEITHHMIVDLRREFFALLSLIIHHHSCFPLPLPSPPSTPYSSFLGFTSNPQRSSCGGDLRRAGAPSMLWEVMTRRRSGGEPPARSWRGGALENKGGAHLWSSDLIHWRKEPFP